MAQLYSNARRVIILDSKEEADLFERIGIQLKCRNVASGSEVEAILMHVQSWLAVN